MRPLEILLSVVALLELAVIWWKNNQVTSLRWGIDQIQSVHQGLLQQLGQKENELAMYRSRLITLSYWAGKQGIHILFPEMETDENGNHE